VLRRAGWQQVRTVGLIATKGANKLVDWGLRTASYVVACGQPLPSSASPGGGDGPAASLRSSCGTWTPEWLRVLIRYLGMHTVRNLRRDGLICYGVVSQAIATKYCVRPACFVAARRIPEPVPLPLPLPLLPESQLALAVRDPCDTGTPSLCWRLQDPSSHGAASRGQLGGCEACCIDVGLVKTCASSPTVTTPMTSLVKRKVAEAVAARLTACTSSRLREDVAR
jgi:hypothetical protein